MAKYNVVSGCGATYSGSDMTVTVAAGSVTLDGSTVTVAGNNVTLVADGSNPRWTWIGINSSGTAVIVSGTATATPTEPPPGDIVEVALVYVTAGATVANSLTAMDRRMFAPTSTDQDSAGLAADVSTTSATLADVTGLSASVAANGVYAFRALVHYTAAAANDYKLGITVPAAATLHAKVIYTNTSGTETIGSITSSGGSVNANGFGATAPGVIMIAGSVLNGANAGSIQIQHALVTVAGTVYTKEKSRIELF